MSPIFDYFFGQYAEYDTFDIVLEIVAVIFGLLSVWFSKQNKYINFRLLTFKVGFNWRYVNKCILFYNEYIWLVHMD